jgi:hypothetical protein
MNPITQHHPAAARIPGPGRQTERTTRRRLRLGAAADGISHGGNPRRGGPRRPVRRCAHRVGGAGPARPRCGRLARPQHA